MDGSKLQLFNSDRISGRAIGYILAFSVLVAAAAAGYGTLPEAKVSASAVNPSAAEVAADEPEIATQGMIDFALNLRSASGYAVYAREGIVERGETAITGARSSSSRTAAGRKAGSEFANAIAAMRQLPCSDAKSTGLTGRTFGPGVYCLGPAELAGELVLDAGGSAAGTFIFLLDGTLNVRNGSSIQLENGAQGGNVFFVAADAEIGDGAEFRGSVIAEGGVKAGRATVTDKVMALGNVEFTDSAVLGGTTGTMRICVDQPLPVSAANSLSNRIFHFTVTGATGIGTAANPVKVTTGTCSKSFDVTAGPQTVTELSIGNLVSPSGATFSGNFELTRVTNLTPSSPSALGSVNLATRAANVNVVAGDSQNQLTLRFTNRRAITGFVEICKKRAAGPGDMNPGGSTLLGGGDQDVQGFFQYTIEDVYSQNIQNATVDANGDGQLDPATLSLTLQVFTIPVGQCTGPIVVTKGDPAPYDIPAASSTVTISELPRAGTFLEAVEVIPSNRRSGADVLGAIIGVDNQGNDLFIPAPGGGHLKVILRESSSAIDETLVIFSNRSNPSRLKICKVAGPGIPVNTLFRFTVSGWGATSAAHPQAASYGPVTRTFDVRAGEPAQGGTCEFVPGVGASLPTYDTHQTFVNGTPVTIVEDGLSPNNTIPQNAGQLRVSMAEVFGSVLSPANISGPGPNPDTAPTSDRIARAVVTARSSIVEMRFSAFRFNPALMKVCKIGLGGAEGQTFNFTITTVSPLIGGPNPGNMFPAFSQNVSVVAGVAGSQEGNCAFVNMVSLPGGAFNQGSTVKVTEGGASPIVSIISRSANAGGFTQDINNRSGIFSGPGGIVAGVNSAVFTNSTVVCRSEGLSGTNELNGLALTTPQCSRTTRFDFDGDRKADQAIFNRSTGMWMWLSSRDVNQLRTRSFGMTGDILVPDDFDGDGLSDYAIFRPNTGQWYIQGTANGGSYNYYNWGEANDKPQVGDYDGDGKADLVVFRPSNGTWYMRNSQEGFRTVHFGVSTDEPVAADYDGDGRVDLAVLRDGTWYSLESTRGFRIVNFGLAGDVPVPADYDGDGMADRAVFRGGTWYILGTANGGTYLLKQLGVATDIPAPADYDGDGKTDLAVYRQSEGRYYIKRSAVGDVISLEVLNFGVTGPDWIPVQAPLRYFLP